MMATEAEYTLAMNNVSRMFQEGVDALPEAGIPALRALCSNHRSLLKVLLFRTETLSVEHGVTNMHLVTEDKDGNRTMGGYDTDIVGDDSVRYVIQFHLYAATRDPIYREPHALNSQSNIMGFRVAVPFLTPTEYKDPVAAIRAAVALFNESRTQLVGSNDMVFTFLHAMDTEVPHVYSLNKITFEKHLPKFEYTEVYVQARAHGFDVLTKFRIYTVDMEDPDANCHKMPDPVRIFSLNRVHSSFKSAVLLP